MGRSVRVEPAAVERGEPLGFTEKLSVGPYLISEPKGGAIGVGGVEAVSPQQGGDVRSGKGHLTERWGELKMTGHVRRSES
jgi:hypothetical protein